MNRSTEFPLVSLCIVTYRQEHFVREAVQSAFALDYPNLEIIISDDCSPDGTFQVLQGATRDYSGPHRVILSKTSKNAGIISNLKSAWDQCSGDFIVVQAGDDISLPQRVKRLVEGWTQEPQVDLVASDVVVIDEHGETLRTGWPDPIVHPLSLEDAVAAGRCYALGCTLGYSRKLITTFGPINPAILQEDWVLPFRALLGRGIRVIPEPLVKYRQHRNNVWFASNSTDSPTRVQFSRMASNRRAIMNEWLAALDSVAHPDSGLRQRLLTLEREWALESACAARGRLSAMGLAIEGLLGGLPLRKTLGLMRRHAFRTVPLRGRPL